MSNRADLAAIDPQRERCRSAVPLGSPDKDLDLRAPDGHLHGIELPTVKATADRGVALAESPRLRLVCDLQDCQTESSGRCHHQPVEKKVCPAQTAA